MAFNNAVNAKVPGIQSISTSGQWNGVTITAGTGITVTNGDGIAGNPTISAAAGAVLVETLTGNSGGAISPTAGNINTLGTGSITIAGAGSTLTTQLTGLTNHAVLVGAGTATITNVGPSATAGQVLQSAGPSADPVFSTATYPATTTVNQILYSSATNVVSGLATANSATLVTTAAGVPVFTSPMTNGQIVIGSTGATPTAATLTAGTGISIATGAASITISAGASVPTTFTTDNATTATPALNNINFFGNATQGLSSSASGSTVTYTIANATTAQIGVTSLATNAETIAGTVTTKAVTPDDLKAKLGVQTAHGLPIGEGTSSAFTWTAAPTAGQVLIGTSATTDPVLSTITPAGGITVTNGSGTITIGTGVTVIGAWQEIAVNTNAVAGNGYISTAALTLTLPASAAMGTSIGTMVLSTGAMTVKAQGGDTIRMANNVSAAAGTAVSQTNGTISGASANFIYDATSTVWFAYAGYNGTWNVT